MKLRMLAEEVVYETRDWQNGSSPTWCFGNTCIVRRGDTVFAGGNVCLDVPSLSRIQWTLWQRRDGAWTLLHHDKTCRTREPSPLVLMGDKLRMSVNPTLVEDTENADYELPARPDVLTFSAEKPSQPPTSLGLTWDGDPPFNEHSYRSFVCDPACDRFVLFNNVLYSHVEWALYRGDQWEAAGKLAWPWEEGYDEPQPVRICYPCVQIRNRAVHFCGVSDVPEPYRRFHDAKQEVDPTAHAFDLRRLFYTWTPDIAQQGFCEWVEISSRDETCGRIFPMDIRVRDDGRVHVIWIEHALNTNIRDRFYPDEKQSWSLMHALLENGKVLEKHALRTKEEGSADPEPRWARFHLPGDGRLMVVYHEKGDSPVTGVLELDDEGRIVDYADVSLKTHFDQSFNASHRCGNAPGPYIDLLGFTRDHVARYACIEVQ